MNPRRLFVASCMSIGTAAMVFAIRGDVAGPMSAAFHLTNAQMGMVFSQALAFERFSVVDNRQVHLCSEAEEARVVGRRLIVRPDLQIGCLRCDGEPEIGSCHVHFRSRCHHIRPCHRPSHCGVG